MTDPIPQEMTDAQRAVFAETVTDLLVCTGLASESGHLAIEACSLVKSDPRAAIGTLCAAIRAMAKGSRHGESVLHALSGLLSGRPAAGRTAADKVSAKARRKAKRARKRHAKFLKRLH